MVRYRGVLDEYSNYLASKTISLLVLFLYIILYPHSRHLIASLGRISFSLKIHTFLFLLNFWQLCFSPVALAADVDHGLLDLSRLLVTLHCVIVY